MARPLIDVAALKRDLDIIVQSHEDPRSSDLRSALLARVKKALAEGRAEAERRLLAGGKGLACAESLSRLADTIISALADLVARRIYPSDNPSEAEHMAILAVGGYGRGTLAPGSDIDLLFLLPYKQTAWGETVAEYVLYMLWDLGQKVGHATRSVDETIRQCKSDVTVRTAVLEARQIWGDHRLLDQLTRRFDEDVATGTGAEFVAAKLAERDERHRRAGNSRYLVEPNVKDGKGGLRDLQTLFWIAKYFYRRSRDRDLVEAACSTRRVPAASASAEDFLWAVRCHLHFLAGRADERLSFDLQREIAAARLYRATRAARRRALHEALLPGRQGRRRPHAHLLLPPSRSGRSSPCRCSTVMLVPP
jgi:[protein-PII] uridylyltransferase